MVASISARGNAAAALGYYAHLRQDDYYSRGGQPPGRWAGDGAARLSLSGPIVQTEFDRALRGCDPKTGERLVQHGGQSRDHSAGWDMTFSAPKSVSVLWALSDVQQRQAIEQAHQKAVSAATRQLEQTAAWARRGKGGSIREQTAGLLLAKFDHHTSRELDPQLHTHSFIFNLAPRQDGTWGAIVSRELYKAQKDAGATYRHELAGGLERLGYQLERDKEGFRVAAVPRSVERAFSKRRQAIEQAAETHGYKTAKGMEMAALRTRHAKQDVNQEQLFKTWEAEAKGLGFSLATSPHRSPVATPSLQHSAAAPTASRPPTRTPDPTSATQVTNAVQALAHHLGRLGRAVSQPAAMPGVRVKLRGREYERD